MKEDTSPKNEAMEYANEEVPLNVRKTAGTILVTLTGYTVSLSNFVTGATVGSKLPFKEAVLACATGNLMLMIVASFLGIIACKAGRTTYVLSKRALGAKSSAIFSAIIVLSSINWTAVNADTFANLLSTTFSWWPIPVAISAIIVVTLWAISAVRGMKGMAIISWLGTPAAVLLTVICCVAISRATGFAPILAYQPDSAVEISFASASSSFAGAWIFGCIVTPDVTRFAKKPAHVVVGAVSAVTIGLFGLETVGILTAQGTNNSDFVSATAALGLGVAVLICAVFAAWTTQQNNIYSGTLAFQDVLNNTPLGGKVRHSTLAILISAAIAIFAAVGAVQFLLPVTQALSVLLPPIPGLMIAQHYFVPLSKEGKSINWVAILAWVLGSTIGFVALQTNFLVPAMVSMACTFVLYILLSRVLDKTWNRDICGEK